MVHVILTHWHCCPACGLRWRCEDTQSDCRAYQGHYQPTCSEACDAARADPALTELGI